MTFQEILAQVIAWLQREHRVLSRALKQQFNLDGDNIADLKEELVYAKRLAVDEEGRILVQGNTRDAPGKRGRSI